MEDTAPAVGPACEAGHVEQEANGAAEEVSDEVVRERLLALLGRTDLSTTTEKMLRKQLEEELGAPLSSKKALIRAEVMKYLEEHQQQDEEEEGQEEEEEDEEEEEEQPRKKAGSKRRGSGLGSVLSEPMQEFLGVKSMARSQVVKAIWEYIKANNLQEPKDKRSIIVDEKLATIFTPPINMFNMNKQLSKHVFTRDVVGAGSDDDDEDGGGAKRPAAKRPPAKRAKKGGEEGKSSRAGTGFAKPLPLSAELAAACGQPELSRGAFQKWLYGYVDEHNLKDPSDKRYALSNETLEKLTGEKRFMLFGAQKLFKEHFLK